MCPFCKLSDDECVHVTSVARAFRDQFPVSPGHTLVIPTKHVASLFELGADEQAELWKLVAEIRLQLETQFHPDGFNIGLNDGTAAGQTVIRGGISRAGVSGSFTYSTKKAMADKPVTFVNWFNCIRFVNWMHNGMPSGQQGPSTTEDGAYTITGTGPDWTVSTRNPRAKVWLTSEDEWYKAAYYDPAKNNGAGGYWFYPTQSDTPPAIATCDQIGNITNKSLNVANYDLGAVWNGQTGNLTTVGSGGPGSQSAYQAADMAGNAFEWTEGIMNDTRRVVRGNSWKFGSNGLLSTYRSSDSPAFQGDYSGFRIAKKP
jgi:hypothetical protein